MSIKRTPEQFYQGEIAWKAEMNKPDSSALELENQELQLRLEEARKTIKQLTNDLHNGRDYLMTVQPQDLTVEDCLIAFGWNSDGF